MEPAEIGYFLANTSHIFSWVRSFLGSHEPQNPWFSSFLTQFWWLSEFWTNLWIMYPWIEELSQGWGEPDYKQWGHWLFRIHCWETPALKSKSSWLLGSVKNGLFMNCLYCLILYGSMSHKYGSIGIHNCLDGSLLLMALDVKIWLQMAYMAPKLLKMAKLAQYGSQWPIGVYAVQLWLPMAIDGSLWL